MSLLERRIHDVLRDATWRRREPKFKRAYALDRHGNLIPGNLGPRALWLAEMIDAFAPDEARPEETTMAPSSGDYDGSGPVGESEFVPPRGWSFSEWLARKRLRGEFTGVEAT